MLDYYELVEHLYRQRAWSFKAFGPPTPENDRREGVLKHIAKELAEIRENPDDIEEWIDVVFLAFDGALRAGATPKQVARTLLNKMVKNEARDWPDWRKTPPGNPIEHIRT